MNGAAGSDISFRAPGLLGIAMAWAFQAGCVRERARRGEADAEQGSGRTAIVAPGDKTAVEPIFGQHPAQPADWRQNEVDKARAVDDISVRVTIGIDAVVAERRLAQWADLPLHRIGSHPSRRFQPALPIFTSR